MNVAGKQTIAACHAGATASQVSLNCVISKGAIPVPGIKTAAQALDNAAAMTWRLSPEEVTALDAASDRITG